MSGEGWRFTRSPRWIGYAAFVVAFAVACVLLSQWQFDRLEEARTEVARVAGNWDSPAEPLREVLPSLDSFEADQKWQPVLLQGRYLAQEQVLARGRPYGGKAGFAVLVPFQLDDGTVFIVDRGWVPAGNEQDAPDAVPAPPAGQVTVVARLKPGEPVVPGRSAPAGQVATINLDQLAQLLEHPVHTGAYGVLDSEDPSPAAVPAPTLRPVPDEGPHLSYALQWVAFGILGFIALAWAVRHEYRIRNEHDPKVRRSAERRRERAARRGPTDADIEDALLDEAER